MLHQFYIIFRTLHIDISFLELYYYTATIKV